MFADLARHEEAITRSCALRGHPSKTLGSSAVRTSDPNAARSQGVHDRAVLVEVVHRQLQEMDPVARRWFDLVFDRVQRAIDRLLPDLETEPVERARR